MRSRLYLSTLAIFLLAAPFMFTARYSQHVLILVLLYVALGSAWNILGGFAGQLSLGHAAFFGIGAYSAAVIASKTGLSPWWGIIAGPIVVLPIALVVGWICFRLRGPYFTLATIAVGFLALHVLAGTMLLQAPEASPTTQQDTRPSLYD